MRAFSSALNRDRRAHPREVVNRRAKVLDGPYPLNAVIKDVSASGAKLAFPDRTPSHDVFVLIDVTAAMAYECHLAWRKGGECGVRLMKGQDLRGLVPGQFDPAKRLWLASR